MAISEGLESREGGTGNSIFPLRRSRLQKLLKRALDLAIALPLLILCAPVFLLIAVLIRVDSPGNPFFAQKRIGQHGKPFTLIKYRSMYIDQCVIVWGKEVRKGDPRVTRMGEWLRRSKVDELLQLINVVLGEMSIVGPRPDIPEQAEKYDPFQQQRLLVRPGLTGVAQISGNTHLPWSERIKLDVWYTQNWSLWLDLRICFLTFGVLLAGEQPDADPLGVRAAAGLK